MYASCTIRLAKLKPPTKPIDPTFNNELLLVPKELTKTNVNGHKLSERILSRPAAATGIRQASLACVVLIPHPGQRNQRSMIEKV